MTALYWLAPLHTLRLSEAAISERADRRALEVVISNILRILIFVTISSLFQCSCFAIMEGYEKLAELMGERPTLGIFRRFSSLGAKNLLYLQAELVSLESELKRCVAEDNSSGDAEKLEYAVNWYSLMRSEEKGKSMQWTIMQDIRRKLREYSMIHLKHLIGGR
jgi:hypothetical protein